MNKINVMSENLANKIAAGEVVERIANVIKELVENSIDAGSKNIKIELTGAGTKLIRIVDDGCGMLNYVFKDMQHLKLKMKMIYILLVHLVLEVKL